MTKSKSQLKNILWIPAAAIFLFLCNSTAEESVRETLDLCARVLIPSLFPYMVISALIARTGAAEILGAPFAPIVRRMFRLPGCSSGAVLLGVLCGFPVGAQMACELYLRGDLTKREAERLLPLANCAGPAFVMEVVGVCLWNNRGFGIFLYIIQILAAWGVSAFAARHEKARKQETNDISPQTVDSVSGCIANAVSSAAMSMLKICGFIVFFSVLISMLRRFFSHFGLSFLAACSAAILEFTAGCRTAAEIGGNIGHFLTGFAVGWSGLSVFSQCLTLTAPAGISLRFALISKSIQGILCGMASCLWFAVHAGNTAVSCIASVSAEFPAWTLHLEIVLLIFFCLCPLPPTLCRKTQK